LFVYLVNASEQPAGSGKDNIVVYILVSLVLCLVVAVVIVVAVLRKRKRSSMYNLIILKYALVHPNYSFTRLFKYIYLSIKIYMNRSKLGTRP